MVVLHSMACMDNMLMKAPQFVQVYWTDLEWGKGQWWVHKGLMMLCVHCWPHIATMKVTHAVDKHPLACVHDWFLFGMVAVAHDGPG